MLRSHVRVQDPDRCIDALVVMGVLVEGGDRQAIRRTAEFFLKTFQVRGRAHAGLRGTSCSSVLCPKPGEQTGSSSETRPGRSAICCSWQQAALCCCHYLHAAGIED